MIDAPIVSQKYYFTIDFCIIFLLYYSQRLGRPMNRLSIDKRVSVVSALVEGNSIRAIERMTGVAKHTILNLLRDLGCACADYHHRNVRNLRIRRLQCDEIWSFVEAKRKNVTPEQEEEWMGRRLDLDGD